MPTCRNRTSAFSGRYTTSGKAEGRVGDLRSVLRQRGDARGVFLGDGCGVTVAWQVRCGVQVGRSLVTSEERIPLAPEVTCRSRGLQTRMNSLWSTEGGPGRAMVLNKANTRREARGGGLRWCGRHSFVASEQHQDWATPSPPKRSPVMGFETYITQSRI